MGNSEPMQLYTAASLTLFFGTAAVAFRFLARSKVKAGVWWDDWLILIALIFFYAQAALSCASTALLGLCHHGDGLDPKTQVVPFYKSLLSLQILYFTTNVLVKISLLILYYRLFNPSKTFRRTVYGLGALVLVWYIGVFLATIFGCVPPSYLWDKSISGRCNDFVKSTYGTGITNMLFDFIILCMPFPMIYRLNTNKRARLVLIGIFMLGFFVCAISVIRITTIHNLTQTDITWATCHISIWSFVEPSCGMIGTCLPTFKPLLPRKFFQSSSHSTSDPESGGSGGGTKKTPIRSPKPRPGFSRLYEKDDIPLTDYEADADGEGNERGRGRPVVTTQIEVSSEDGTFEGRTMEREMPRAYTRF